MILKNNFSLIISILIFLLFTNNSLQKINEEQELKFLEDSSNTQKTPILKSDNIINDGMGYSSDTELPAATSCFQVLQKSKGNQQSILNFSQSADYNEVLSTFDLSLTIKGGYGAFSGSSETGFFKSLLEKSYSLSINYYQKISQTVSYTYSYAGESMLNETGVAIYNKGNNPLFRLLCGDYLIKSYTEGAGLIFSIDLDFQSTEDKKKFTESATARFGSFINASLDISKTFNSLNIKGTINIKAFQLGGDPTKLSKILSSNVVSCDINDIEACQQTAGKMIEYASDVFPLQFDGPSGKWSSNFNNLGSIKKDFSVKNFGLKLSDSFVTEKVKEQRKELISRINEMYFYSNSVKEYLKYSTYGETSPLKKLIKNINKEYSLLQKGAEIFSYPNRADEIYNEIKKELYPDLAKKVKETLDNSKFYFKYRHLTFTVYNYKDNNGDYQLQFEINGPIKLSNVNFTDLGKFEFDILFANLITYHLKVDSVPKGDKFVGTFCSYNDCEQMEAQRNIDKFWFEYDPVF